MFIKQTRFHWCMTEFSICWFTIWPDNVTIVNNISLSTLFYPSSYEHEPASRFNSIQLTEVVCGVCERSTQVNRTILLQKFMKKLVGSCHDLKSKRFMKSKSNKQLRLALKLIFMYVRMKYETYIINLKSFECHNSSLLLVLSQQQSEVALENLEFSAPESFYWGLDKRLCSLSFNPWSTCVVFRFVNNFLRTFYFDHVFKLMHILVCCFHCVTLCVLVMMTSKAKGVNNFLSFLSSEKI